MNEADTAQRAGALTPETQARIAKLVEDSPPLSADLRERLTQLLKSRRPQAG
ncbi:hypothetical protein [Amycolatopsis xylanica]|uniref:hypothetical protein n=1 Tax=Amycolatopsis xylanica TaxID=589385 RepID=UPI0015A400DA|nr:hypothetical protein [Amycolatopsis xylanica]